MKKSFKVGDIVTGNKQSDTKYVMTTSKMTRGRVTEVPKDGWVRVAILEHETRPRCVGDDHLVETQYFDLVKPAQQSIHITSDGDTTHAVLKQNDKIVSRAKAVRSSDDTYDFWTGALLALSRIPGAPPALKKKVPEGCTPKAKPPKGDLVVGARVKIRDDLHVAGSGTYGKNAVISDMVRHAGKTAIVTEIDNGHGCRLDVDCYRWTREMLSSIEPPSQEGEIKVGSRVRIRKDMESGRNYGGLHLLPSMSVHCGEEHTVVAVTPCKNYTLNGNSFSWSREMLEVIEPPTKFTFDAFQRGKFAVHCDTEDKARQLLAYLHGKGVKWASKEKATLATFYEQYGSETCYVVRKNNGITYDNRQWFKSINIPIIPFSAADLD